jgi:hypothetical protein
VVKAGGEQPDCESPIKEALVGLYLKRPALLRREGDEGERSPRQVTQE